MNIIYLLILAFCLLVLYYLRNGAIYLPTSETAVQTMLRLAGQVKGLAVADLGSGDGRILIAFAKVGASTTGYENNPILVLWSWWKIRLTGVSNAHVKMRSFWSEDMSRYDIVVVFGMTHIMDRLGEKLSKEMKPGSRIISNVFKFKNFEREAYENGVSIYKIL